MRGQDIPRATCFSERNRTIPARRRSKGEAPPIYRERGRTYHADTCAPLVEAVDAGEVRLAALARGTYPGRRIPGPDLPGLRSVGVWDAPARQTWGLDWHRNEGLELTLLETGSLSFEVRGEGKRVLRSGALTITRPWQPHRVGDPNVTPSRLHWLILDLKVRRPNQDWEWPGWLVLTPRDLRELTDLLRHNERSVWPATDDLTNCFRRIAPALEGADVRANLSRIGVRVNELFVLLLDLLRGQQVPLDASLATSERTVGLFLSELARRPDALAHPWSVGEMAAQCGLGVTYFIRYCRQITNMTPARYLNHHRLRRASELLRGGLAGEDDLTIAEVARRCGFASPRYFASAFRRSFRCTPTRFRSGGGAVPREAKGHPPQGYRI